MSQQMQYIVFTKIILIFLCTITSYVVAVGTETAAGKQSALQRVLENLQDKIRKLENLKKEEEQKPIPPGVDMQELDSLVRSHTRSKAEFGKIQEKAKEPMIRVSQEYIKRLEKENVSLRAQLNLEFDPKKGTLPPHGILERCAALLQVLRGRLASLKDRLQPR